MEPLVITEKQFQLIRDFMTHIWHSVHFKTKTDHFFWAEKLDALKIPFEVQNTAANLMEDRSNGFMYFRNLLTRNNIVITKENQCI